MVKHEKTRLRWGCRRGMLELDLILLPFFEENFDSLPEEQQGVFQEFLTEADQDIYAWILNYQVCENLSYKLLLKRIQQFAHVDTHDH
jgi:antitoxin CptB